MSAPQLLVPGPDGVWQPHEIGLVEQTNEDYQTGPGISKSQLDVMWRSPLDYWAKYVDPNREPEEPTQAKMLGSAIHSAILEPDLFPTQYVEAPDFNLRSNAGRAEFKAFKQEHAGCVVLRPEDRKLCLAIRDAVWRHPKASALLQGCVSEKSFYAIDPETGELIKCRVDALHPSGAYIADIKSTDDASPDAFGKSAANYRYPLQTAWYQDVFDAAFDEHPDTWVFIAVQKTWPHPIGIYYPEPEHIEEYRKAGRRDLKRIIECRERREWPDYGFTPQALQLPTWRKP